MHTESNLESDIVTKAVKGTTFKPSAIPGPRNDLEEVRLALSKLDLKTNGNPSLQKLQKKKRRQSLYIS